MGYRHRTQRGKYINFKSKNAYENWKRGMFANLSTSNSSKRKVAKVKSKSRRRLQHAGVGRVSSTKKKRCDYCRKENLPLTEGRCKVCAKDFAEFKQPEKPKKLREELKELMVAYDPNYDNEDLFKIQTLIDEINELDSGHLELVGKMEEINAIMGGHGIEGINKQVGDHTLDLMYVNMGESYDTTVIYDFDEGMARIGDWGSYVEELQTEEELPDWDEAIMSGEEDL